MLGKGNGLKGGPVNLYVLAVLSANWVGRGDLPLWEMQNTTVNV